MIRLENVIVLTRWCPEIAASYGYTSQWLLIDEDGETYYARFRCTDLTVQSNGYGGEQVFCEPQQTQEKHCMSYPELKDALQGHFEFPNWVKQKLLVDDPYPDVPGTMPCGQWKFVLDNCP